MFLSKHIEFPNVTILSFQKLVQVLGCPCTSSSGGGGSMDDPFEKTVYVLTSNSFQKWFIGQGDPEKMIYSADLETIAKQAFATNTWVSLVEGLVTHSNVVFFFKFHAHVDQIQTYFITLNKIVS